MPNPVYMIGFVVGKHFPIMTFVLPYRLLSECLGSADTVRSVEETGTLLLRASRELKKRPMMVAAESGVTTQSIGRRALEIEALAREEMLVGNGDRDEQIRHPIRSRGSPSLT